MERDRSRWQMWNTRIPEEEGDLLMEYCKKLKEKGQLENIGKYTITRLALKSLLRTLMNLSRNSKIDGTNNPTSQVNGNNAISKI